MQPLKLSRTARALFFLSTDLSLVILLLVPFIQGCLAGFGANDGLWMEVDRRVLHIALMLGIVVLFRRRLTADTAAFAVMGGLLLALTGLLDYTLPNLLSEMPAYVAAFSREGAAPNPQYPKLLMLAAVAGAVFYLAYRQFSLSRLFAGIALAAILVTTFAFHTVLVKGLLLPQLKENEKSLYSQVAAAPRLKPEQALRAQGLAAYVLHDEAQLKDFLASRYPQRGVYEMWSNYRNPQGPTPLSVGSFVNNRFERASLVIAPQSSGEILLASNERETRALQARTEAAFGLLACIAHGFWLTFATLLALFHESRLARRRAQY